MEFEATDSVNAMDGIGTDPSSTSVRLWYDDGTFRARDAYHILGNKRTTVASRCGRAIGILYKVGKKVVVVKWRMKVFCPEIHSLWFIRNSL